MLLRSTSGDQRKTLSARTLQNPDWLDATKWGHELQSARCVVSALP
jgi:hypothetical protein